MLTVIGEIVRNEVKSYTDRRTGRPAYRLEALLSTDGPALRMTFFAKNKHSADWRARTLAVGRRGLFLGQVSSFQSAWQLTNPKMVLFGEGEDGDPEGEASWIKDVGEYYPIYPLTKGIESWDLQRAVTFARTVVDDLPELVPDEVRDGVRPRRRPHRARLDPRARQTSVRSARPSAGSASRRRWSPSWCWSVAARRCAAWAPRRGPGTRATCSPRSTAGCRSSSPRGQREIGAEIEHDLAQPHPMNRLLQGEVGSGKTVVALRAMLRTVDSGGQAALLAPTEVLAQQHHRSITAMLGELAAGGMLGGADGGTTVALLTGSMTKAQRTEPMLRMATGEAGIVIGTHALLEERVGFADLGLVVVDEQHRFGVEQRAALTDKAGTPPHVLVMTATPIPRTVAMTVFGDLETSTLTELPAGRAPIQTNVVPLAEHGVVDRPGVGARARGGRQGPPGVRRVPADHRRRERAGGDRPARPGRSRRGRQPHGAVRGVRAAERGRGGRRRARRGTAQGPAPGEAARQDDRRREGAHDARLRGGGDRRAGVHHGHRGRRRRRQRDRDGAAGRRAVRRLAAAPAPRPGRPGRAPRAVPAGHPRLLAEPVARAARRGRLHHGRVRAEPRRPRAAPRG